MERGSGARNVDSWLQEELEEDGGDGTEQSISQVRTWLMTEGMVHSDSGRPRGVQVKLWDPLRTRAILERLRGVFTTRRYTNPRLPDLTLPKLKESKIRSQKPLFCYPFSPCILLVLILFLHAFPSLRFSLNYYRNFGWSKSFLTSMNLSECYLRFKARLIRSAVSIFNQRIPQNPNFKRILASRSFQGHTTRPIIQNDINIARKSYACMSKDQK